MRKLFTFLALAILALLPCAGNAQQLVKVYVNGVKVDTYPRMKDGVAFIQVTPIARALGVSISWNPQSRIVKVDNRVISTTPLEIDGMLFLPIESVASASGATVEWDGSGNVIRLTRAGATPAADPAAIETPSPPIPAMKPAPVQPQPSPTQPAPVNPFSTSPVPNPPPVSQSNPYNYDGTPSSSDSSTSGTYIPKPPPTYADQPSKSAYPDGDVSKNASFQPKDAPPRMPSNLSLPPMGHMGKVSSPEQTYHSSNKYVPRSESNDVFRVTVTNVELVNSIKDYYKAKPGYRFMIVYLSQQNISEEVQVYTGRFSVLDSEKRSYDYIEGLSNFWLVILRPGGINFGYLVFEVPNDVKAAEIVLHGLNKAPLAVGLN
jgi:hypothetical protein